MACRAHRARMGGLMSKTLLLADDSVVIQKLVGLSFANEDVEIVTTDNGDDAVVKAREIRPDVVLADVVMPGKSGYEVCEAIKQDPALAQIPVLLLTGTFEAFDEARATAAGANGQITKPFEAQALVERVNEVMNAPVAVASEPEPPFVEATAVDAAAVDAAAGEYDFFDSDVATLSVGDTNPGLPISRGASSASGLEQTPMIETDEAHFFGSPGEGATEELDTLGGGLALGESVAQDRRSEIPNIPDIPDNDATIAILPDTPPPLPPSMGDPLVGFEDDLALADLSMAPPVPPPSSIDLDSALDSVPTDPGATIVAEVNDTNATTSPDQNAPSPPAIADEFDDLTVHTPSSAIDHDVASAPSPSPVAIGSIPVSGNADATVVTNLDISLAEPASEAIKSTPQPLDLGPSNISPQDLDFAFDVSEQVPAGDLEDALADSFSSLMDISESQILAGPPSDPPPVPDSVASDTVVVDDSFAAGYDVSSSDLATAPPTHETPVVGGFAAGVDESIALGLNVALKDGLRENPSEDRQQHTGRDLIEIPDNHAAHHDRLDEDLLHEGSAPNAVELALPVEEEELELGVPTPTSSGNDRIADLSPLVEQRIQETLEKVAWEAFSDLSETIVKQVIGRIEQIAWEVIPQMAETLVREEIRKMKGEGD
jgi:CheY-like chemotaxis protein